MFVNYQIFRKGKYFILSFVLYYHMTIKSKSSNTGGTPAIQKTIFVNHVLTDMFVCCMWCRPFDMCWRYLLLVLHVSNNLQIYKQKSFRYSARLGQNTSCCTTQWSHYDEKLPQLCQIPWPSDSLYPIKT